MTCHLGGFPTLQPLTGETLTARSTNTDDNAQLDIHARGFWKGSQDVFFFWCKGFLLYFNAPSNRSTDTYRRHEQAKKREYGQRVQEVECGVFTPLVPSTNGRMEKDATAFYKRLADMTAQKRLHHYSMVMGCLRCRISFASLRSSVMCIHGSRSPFQSTALAFRLLPPRDVFPPVNCLNSFGHLRF